jgi:hypothetical protein
MQVSTVATHSLLHVGFVTTNAPQKRHKPTLAPIICHRKGSNRRPTRTTQHYLPLHHFLVVWLFCETLCLCPIFPLEILYLVISCQLTISLPR